MTAVADVVITGLKTRPELIWPSINEGLSLDGTTHQLECMLRYGKIMLCGNLCQPISDHSKARSKMSANPNTLTDKERITALETALKYLATKADLESKINNQTALIVAALLLMTAILGFLVTRPA